MVSALYNSIHNTFKRRRLKFGSDRTSFDPSNQDNDQLSLHDVSVNLGGRQLLDRVNLSLHKGELTVLLGPNGTGKSSLLKTFTSEIPFSGSTKLFGKPLNQWPSHALAKQMGVLPQHSQLTFNFTVREVVELGGLGLSAEKVQLNHIVCRNMMKCDVYHLADRSYPTLSGGEKQRVHFARVLTQLEQSGRDKVLLMDEPTSALDIQHQHRTLTIAKEIAHAGGIVVVVLHDLNLAAQYADRIVLLDGGQIVENGAPLQALTPMSIERVYHHSVNVMPHPLHGYPVVY
ncbi:heme ABC transporter ATP-binding protein [Vibrio sp. qd031]|uniref:heme ABC transporter ATP-binding protein n=1 Tax=Vibrio sp. qd031 TaxID=1603038 RepID=UPI000A1131F8|nr:heme ABC transporter ATP-binding protein [Vibrio sp. qd031]